MGGDNTSSPAWASQLVSLCVSVSKFIIIIIIIIIKLLAWPAVARGATLHNDFVQRVRERSVIISDPIGSDRIGSFAGNPFAGFA